MADCRVGNVAGQVLATYALGSCIGLVGVRPARRRLGGLLHYMLPDSASTRRGAGRTRTCSPIPAFPCCSSRSAGKARQGAVWWRTRPEEPRSWIRRAIFDIGKRNYLALRKILWKAGILLTGEAVGGGIRAPYGWRSAAAGSGCRKAAARSELVALIPSERRNHMAYRVLIADDSPAMRSFVRRVIELSGFELSACFEAGDGAEALAVLQTRMGRRHPHRHQHAGSGRRRFPAPAGGGRIAARAFRRS